LQFSFLLSFYLLANGCHYYTIRETICVLQDADIYGGSGAKDEDTKDEQGDEIDYLAEDNDQSANAPAGTSANAGNKRTREESGADDQMVRRFTLVETSCNVSIILTQSMPLCVSSRRIEKTKDTHHHQALLPMRMV
jgi:hypothetical protein